MAGMILSVPRPSDTLVINIRLESALEYNHTITTAVSLGSRSALEFRVRLMSSHDRYS